MAYDHQRIENKWVQYWDEHQTFYCDTHDFTKPKYYVLDMFPFPSAQGLHVGHPEGYTATDIVARMKRMQGYNVLHPMGWDAFGLPSEQYAIEHNEHPEKATRENISRFRKQIKSLGMSIDWSKEIATIDPGYYKWTQWIFAKMFEHDLAYVADIPVNFCPELGTVLANEEVIDGVSERGGYPVIRMPMRQWMLKITAYAEDLEKDLEGLDWPKSTIEMQKNWIGRSSGVEVTFDLAEQEGSFRVYTTRVDTLYGCTYCVLAPEHPLALSLAKGAQKEAVKKYIEETTHKSELTRISLSKEKTGVFTGSYAINPINNERVPIWLADYVLSSYGTGAVMACPAHDERDYSFAKEHNLKIVPVLESDISQNAFTGDAPHINSGRANGLLIDEAKRVIFEELKSKRKGEEKINCRLRDWIFSRQRYWGEPIPTFQTEDNVEHVLKDEELPLTLPLLSDYRPSKDGKPPLARAPKEWLEFEYQGQKAVRETNTMPQWAGSSWYYIRYLDPHNDKELADPKLIEHWLPVDLYIGGQEHAVLHLLYARFWHKFLYDLGITKCKEPFKRLFHQGMILGSNNEKMSKSRGNVVNPDDVVRDSGADSLRLFEMFMGPLEESKPWNTEGLKGARRFIERVYRLYDDESFRLRWSVDDDGELAKEYNAMIQKCTLDFEALHFNTAIAQMMIFVNACYKAQKLKIEYLDGFCKVFSCICPFVGEEMWEKLNHHESIAYASWPSYDPKLLEEEKVTLVLAINGKARATIEVEKNLKEEEIIELAKNNEKIARYLEGAKIVKTIFVPGKIFNFIVK